MLLPRIKSGYYSSEKYSAVAVAVAAASITDDGGGIIDTELSTRGCSSSSGIAADKEWILQ